jgi:hypothetical protein
MINQSYILTNKISIAAESNANPNPNIDFYEKYSRFTLKALSKNVFQEFIIDMLKLENISQRNLRSIRIEIFPAPRKNGSTIAGKCNTVKGKIRIYPKSRTFCNAFGKEYGRYILVAYAGNRARASLIHELLHLKYGSDEVKVRKLTQNYFSQLIKKGYSNSSNSLSVYNLIFAHRA